MILSNSFLFLTIKLRVVWPLTPSKLPQVVKSHGLKQHLTISDLFSPSSAILSPTPLDSLAPCLRRTKLADAVKDQGQATSDSRTNQSHAPMVSHKTFHPDWLPEPQKPSLLPPDTEKWATFANAFDSWSFKVANFQGPNEKAYLKG